MGKRDKSKQKLEDKKKLNFMERFAVKRMLKKAKKLSKEQLRDEKMKDKLVFHLMELTEILTIEDDGKPISKDLLQTHTIDELADLFDDCLKAVEKIV